MEIEQFKIEKNVPLPTAKSLYRNFLSAMEIGDSFECERRHYPRVHLAARYAEVKIKTKQTTGKSIRVWRIA